MAQHSLIWDPVNATYYAFGSAGSWVLPESQLLYSDFAHDGLAPANRSAHCSGFSDFTLCNA